MDLGPHLREGLGRCLRVIPVNAPIPHVIFKTAGVYVKAPGTKLGAIESQLKPVVALFEIGFASASLREERSQNEGVDRHHRDGHLSTLHTLRDRDSRVAKSSHTESCRADHGDRGDEGARDWERWRAAGCQP